MVEALLEVWRNGCGSRWRLRRLHRPVKSGSGPEVTADQDSVITLYLPWSLVCLLCACWSCCQIRSPRLWNRNCVWQKVGEHVKRGTMPGRISWMKKIHKKELQNSKNVKILERAKALRNYWNNILGSSRDCMKLNKYIDHTPFKTRCQQEQIEKLDSKKPRFTILQVSVNPTWVNFAAEGLRDSDVKVCTVIGFPLGANTPFVKACETKCDSKWCRWDWHGSLLWGS